MEIPMLSGWHPHRHLHALEEDVRTLRGALHVGMAWVHGQVVVLLHGVPVDEPRWLISGDFPLWKRWSKVHKYEKADVYGRIPVVFVWNLAQSTNSNPQK